jgi:hypothetical protein
LVIPSADEFDVGSKPSVPNGRFPYFFKKLFANDQKNKGGKATPLRMTGPSIAAPASPAVWIHPACIAFANEGHSAVPDALMRDVSPKLLREFFLLSQVIRRGVSCETDTCAMYQRGASLRGSATAISDRQFCAAGPKAAHRVGRGVGRQARLVSGIAGGDLGHAGYRRSAEDANRL